MSSPSRWKIGCSPVRMMTYRSPAAPPCGPALPLPAIRMRCPSRVPALMRTSSGSVRLTVPSPWQIGAGGNVLARSLAARAWHVELHAPTGLRDLTSSVALRTFARRLGITLPMTIRASVLARNVKAHHAAANGRPEWHVDLIFQVRARLRVQSQREPHRVRPRKFPRRCRGIRPRRRFAGLARAVPQIREVEPAEIKGNALATCLPRTAAGESARRSSASAAARCGHTLPPSPDRCCRNRTRPGRRFCAS